MWYIVNVFTNGDDTRLSFSSRQLAVDVTVRLSELGYCSFITEETERVNCGESEEVRVQQIIAELSRLDIPNEKLN